MKLIASFFIFLSLLVADNLPIKSTKISKTACSQNLKNNQEICQIYTLEYLECDSSCQDRNLEDILYIFQKKYIEKIKKANPNRDLKERVNDEFDSSDWEDNTKISLFATTPNSITLEVESDGFSGGAHGYFSIEYLNIDKFSKKLIKIDDLILPERKREFLKRAKIYYQLSNNLPINKPLTLSDNWFEDKFKLPDSFAITRSGLFFLYNQYEIKAYAYGLSSFFVPYQGVIDLIDPNSALEFIFEQKDRAFYRFVDEKEDNKSKKAISKVYINYLSKNRVNITFDVVFNLRSRARGWISIASRDFKSFKNIRVKSSKEVKVSKYRKNSKIFNIQKHRAIRAKYALLEGEIKDIKNKKHYKISFDMNLPKEVVVMDFRVTAREFRKIVTFNLDDSLLNVVTGQQGFDNHRLLIPINKK